MTPAVKQLPYEERSKQCGLKALKTRRTRVVGDQIEVSNTMPGYEEIDREIFC